MLFPNDVKEMVEKLRTRLFTLAKPTRYTYKRILLYDVYFQVLEEIATRKCPDPATLAQEALVAETLFSKKS